MSERFDAIVVGAGPAGEVAASRLPKLGLRTALVERELVGGECAYWACIPSKTLPRPPEVRFEAQRTAGTAAPQQSWHEVAAYRDYMVRHLDDRNQVDGYERDGVSVYKSEARFIGAGCVEVDGARLESERIVVATGSDPAVPDIPGLRESGYWTNREATNPSGPDGPVSDPCGAVESGLEQHFRSKPVKIAWAMRDIAFTPPILDQA